MKYSRNVRQKGKTFNKGGKKRLFMTRSEFNIEFSLHKRENIINLELMKFSHFIRSLSYWIKARKSLWNWYFFTFSRANNSKDCQQLVEGNEEDKSKFIEFVTQWNLFYPRCPRYESYSLIFRLSASDFNGLFIIVVVFSSNQPALFILKKKSNNKNIICAILITICPVDSSHHFIKQ